MAKYVIRFSPEYRATSLWPDNDAARSDLGMPIEYKKVNLSEDLILRLEKFDEGVMGIIDWSEPNGPSPLSKEERMRLYYEGVQLLGMVRKELGNDYEVRYGLDWIYPSDE
jgi:hypothetical protein